MFPWDGWADCRRQKLEVPPSYLTQFLSCEFPHHHVMPQALDNCQKQDKTQGELVATR